MSDQGTARPNGAAPAEAEAPPPAALSLREVAENAYDEVIDAPESEAGTEPAGQDGPTRDSLGRFAPKTTTEAKPGEAAPPAEAAPSPDLERPASQQDPAHPAPQGSSSEPPANWPADVRERFTKLQPEDQQFLLKRHSEMEGDYQRRVQATATATQFTQAVAPIFNDPVIAGSLQQSNLSPFDAIREWATMHKRAMSPDARDRAQLWHEIGTRLGLDPAAVYGQSQSGPPGQGQLSEADLKDPAIRYFADHVGRTVQEVQALRGQIATMQRMESEKANAEAVKVTRWGIDSFAEEKDAQGNPLRPDFDTLLPQIIELFNANPNRDLREAYETARWMNPQTRTGLIAAERTQVQRQFANDRAKAAVRVNARGVTSPVGKPPDASRGKSLRDTLEATADEIGL
jgi:hypothetical protein